MNRLSGTMRTARTSAWLSATSLLLGAILTQAVQSAPQGTPPVPPAQPLPATIEFNRDIRPILSDKCFQCHGPGTQMATLRFDSEEGAKHALKDGRFAIVPGEPAASQMIARITATNPAVRMPRSQSGAAAGEPLSDRQVALLTRWIEQGATWQKHWSFIPPKRPDLPKDLKDPKWVRNPIDAFVLQRLEREGLKPSPEADQATLLRRVSLDLTGLPPTPAELDAFLADTSPNAYEKVVDRSAAVAAVRRAHGVPLAGRRALCRQQRLPDRRRAVHVAVARLGDRCVQSQHALRPVHDRATGWRPAAERHAGPEDRDRVQSQSPRQFGRRHRPRRVRRRIRRRSRGHDLHGVPGSDGRRARDATTTSSIRSRRRSSISSSRISTTCPSTASSGVWATRRRIWRRRFRRRTRS